MQADHFDQQKLLALAAEDVAEELGLPVAMRLVGFAFAGAGSPDNPSYNGAHVVTEMNRNRVMDSSTYGVPVDSPEPHVVEQRVPRHLSSYAARVFDQGVASAQAIMLLILTIVLARLYVKYVYREV